MKIRGPQTCAYFEVSVLWSSDVSKWRRHSDICLKNQFIMLFKRTICRRCLFCTVEHHLAKSIEDWVASKIFQAALRSRKKLFRSHLQNFSENAINHAETALK